MPFDLHSREPLAPWAGRAPLRASLVVSRDGFLRLELDGGTDEERATLGRAIVGNDRDMLWMYGTRHVSRGGSVADTSVVLVCHADDANERGLRAPTALSLLRRADILAKQTNDRYDAPAARTTA